VTIAEYSSQYVRYLKDREKFEDGGFLTMKMYGPFLTTDRVHMSWLGAVLRTMLPYAATHRPGREYSPSKLRTPSRPPHPSSDQRLGRAPQRRTEVAQQLKGNSSPLGGESEKSLSSTSPDDEERISRQLFKQRLEDRPRSSQRQSPQRGGRSDSQEGAQRRSGSPFANAPQRAGPPPPSTGEQSTQRQGQQSGEQSKGRSGKKGNRK
jgi:hypothetical protein